MGDVISMEIPSGSIGLFHSLLLKMAHLKIVDLPIKDGDFHSYVGLPQDIGKLELSAYICSVSSMINVYSVAKKSIMWTNQCHRPPIWGWSMPPTKMVIWGWCIVALHTLVRRNNCNI